MGNKQYSRRTKRSELVDGIPIHIEAESKANWNDNRVNSNNNINVSNNTVKSQDLCNKSKNNKSNVEDSIETNRAWGVILDTFNSSNSISPGDLLEYLVCTDQGLIYD